MGSEIITQKNVHELLVESVNFFIPSFQRGYRWTQRHVNDLLSDLEEFRTTKPSVNDYYSLQPIVLMKNENNSYNVIDGQQRLTTVHILLSYMYKERGDYEVLFTIDYETRPNSKEFLINIADPDSESKASSNIDFHHIFEAYKTIDDWFESKSDEMGIGKQGLIGRIQDILVDNTMFIWYELPPASNQVDIFTRINMGKIPLTSSELIKALFLTKGNFMDNSHVQDSKTSLSLRQIEIASDWDSMEYELQDDSFWYFLTNEKTDDNRITFILDILADRYLSNGSFSSVTKKNISNDPYSAFLIYNYMFLGFSQNREKRMSQISNLWLQVKRVFQTLVEWYKSRKHYHLVGYLVSQNVSIEGLLNTSDKLNKSEFVALLEEKIAETLIEVTCIEDLSIEAIRKKNLIRRVLLLFNIISLESTPQAESRFPFHLFKNEKIGWDLEHIHATKSTPPLDRRDQREWLENLVETNKIGNILPDDIIEEVSTILSAEPFSGKEFVGFYEKIVTKYGAEEEIDGIGNLTLLDAGTNRAYKNSLFPLKRNLIIQRDKQGVYVPLCTKNVFLKYYTKKPKDYLVWTKEDQRDYLFCMKSMLEKYLPKEGMTNGHK